jgi:hypothetical protein
MGDLGSSRCWGAVRRAREVERRVRLRDSEFAVDRVREVAREDDRFFVCCWDMIF